MEQSNQPVNSPGSLVQIESRRSPLIPRSIDNTALDMYMACPRKFYYGMVLNRRRGGPLSPALAYGTVWHKILETHYRTGGNAAAVRSAAIAAWQPHFNPDDHRTLDRALSAYEGYLARWGEHDAEIKGWGKTVGYPDSPVIENATEIWWPGAPHPYAGKIDRVFELQGLFYVEDHKTSSQLGTNFFVQFDPSNQMMGYAALAQLLTGLPIAGVRINAHGVLKTQNKFERKIITYSQPRLREWQENYARWIDKLEGSYRRHGLSHAPEMGETDDLLSAWPHNFNACAARYGQCTYADVCAQVPHVRGRILESEFDEIPWDPMASAEAGDAAE
jgi:hypothetical protein